MNEETLFLIANELLSPSYISLETALSWYGVIPEGVYTITSVSTIRVIDYNTDISNFSYRKIKANAFFGDNLVEIQGLERKYRIASIEKAIVDYLYYHDEITSVDDIEGLRFNSDIFAQKVDYKILITYADSMDNIELLKRVKTLIDYYRND